MDFWNAHLQSPKSLAPGPDYAPAIVVYPDKAFTLVITSTQLQMTIGGDPVNLTFTGETLETLAENITTLSEAVTANAVNRSHQLLSGQLFYDGEMTPDGGHIIRLKGHIVRYSEETRIRPLLPYPDDRSRPWWPRIDRGNVWVETNGVRYLFGVPEYNEQEWSSYFGAPFIDVFGVRGQIIDEKTIRVPFKPIFWYQDNIRIEVNGVQTGSNLIADVDTHNGFIKLTGPVIPQDRLYLDYTYRESSLLYKDVNLNPSPGHNPAIVDQAVLIYLVPEASSLGHERTHTVRHVVGKTIVGALTAIPRATEPALIVGAYQVRPTTVLDDLEVTDTRRFGGGLSEHRFDEAIGVNRDMHSLTDWGRYDGTPFPGAQSGILKLPRSLMDSIDKDLAEQLVKKHFAAGGALLLDFTEDLE